jgi:hypothetical protein
MKKLLNWDARIARRVRLRDLHVLLTVVQHGSMGQATSSLGVSRPAISDAIATLEVALWVRLLDRSRRAGQPTIKYGRLAIDSLRRPAARLQPLSPIRAMAPTLFGVSFHVSSAVLVDLVFAPDGVRCGIEISLEERHLCPRRIRSTSLRRSAPNPRHQYDAINPVVPGGRPWRTVDAPRTTPPPCLPARSVAVVESVRYSVNKQTAALSSAVMEATGSLRQSASGPESERSSLERQVSRARMTHTRYKGCKEERSRETGVLMRTLLRETDDVRGPLFKAAA